MQMANLWEQMVFDLKIESADIPRNEPVGASKIHGGFHLMNGPSFSIRAGSPTGSGKSAS